MKKALFIVFIASAMIGVFSSSLSAQNSAFPTVTVHATDPDASESGPDTGTFTFRRTGGTNTSLVVFFRVGGTASNGVDYQTISNETVAIPAGSYSASVTITPIDDSIIEGSETVEVQVTESLMMCPACGYNIGSPSNAVVNIADNDQPTTRPLSVHIYSPQNGETFVAPADIMLRAYAEGARDYSNLKVEFFEGNNSLGFGTFVAALCPAPYCPFYALTWSNVPPGQYTLTAKATDSSSGESAVSDPVYIQVFDGVNIYATDPSATEQPATSDIPPDSATFTVQRSETNGAITVFYSVSGTASNGVDYHRLSGEVTIPEGARSADIIVTPIDDNAAEGTENIVLRLLPPCPPCLFQNPPCDVPQGENCYPIGPHNQALAYIRDNDPPTNHPPHVQINVPHDGEVFTAPADVTLRAYAQDAEDSYYVEVEFFEGNNSLGFAPLFRRAAQLHIVPTSS